MQVLVDLIARWSYGFLLRLCPGKQCLRVHCTLLEDVGTVGQHLSLLLGHVHAMWSLCTSLYCAAQHSLA